MKRFAIQLCTIVVCYTQLHCRVQNFDVIEKFICVFITNHCHKIRLYAHIVFESNQNNKKKKRKKKNPSLTTTYYNAQGT